MSAEDHESISNRDPRTSRLAVAVITVSDTRTPATDRGGDRLETLVAEAGHRVVQREIVRDDPAAVDSVLQACLGRSEVDAVLLTGGTGISPRDGTIEVVRRHLRVELPGYGELVRRLGVDQVGPAAILSRAVAGVTERPIGDGGPVLVFTMPGSVQAVESAMSGVVIPILPHAAWEARKGLEPPSDSAS